MYLRFKALSYFTKVSFKNYVALYILNNMVKKRARKIKRAKQVKRSSYRRKTSVDISKSISTKRKINVVISNLIIFAILTLILIGLDYLTNHEGLSRLLAIFSIVTGFIAFAFFLVLLIFLALRLMRK